MLAVTDVFQAQQCFGRKPFRIELGGDAQELPDGIRITPAPLHGGLWRAHHDHRIATAGALIGLRVPGVEVDDIGTTAKTMPEFPQLWAQLLDEHGSTAA